MGVVANEPSMEEILSSIKRIIGEGGEASPARTPRQRKSAAGDPPAATDALAEELVKETEILELTERAEAPGEAQAAPVPSGAILSDSSATAARLALSQLSTLLVKQQEGEAATLEGLVREMLRPMLSEWLDAHLPDLVEGLVKKEIDRIVGRLG